MSVTEDAWQWISTRNGHPYLIIGIGARLWVANILHFDDKSKHLPEISILMLTFAAYKVRWLCGYKVLRS